MSGTGRTVIALGLVGAMLVALVAILLSGGGDDDPVATSPSTTTTTTITTSTSTTLPTTTTTTTLDPDARLAEVEQILEDLEIRWYDAVYRKDFSQLPEFVAIQQLVDDASVAADSLEFLQAPDASSVNVTVYSVLLDREDCLVVHRQLDLQRVLGPGAIADGVQVLWPTDSGYRLARLWTNPGDLWQDDCDLMDRNEVPLP